MQDGGETQKCDQANIQKVTANRGGDLELNDVPQKRRKVYAARHELPRYRRRAKASKDRLCRAWPALREFGR